MAISLRVPCFLFLLCPCVSRTQFCCVLTPCDAPQRSVVAYHLAVSWQEDVCAVCLLCQAVDSQPPTSWCAGCCYRGWSHYSEALLRGRHL
jgi:hypothetical protein